MTTLKITIENDGSLEHVVKIDGRQHRIWSGHLPSGAPVDVVVQSIRPKAGAPDEQVAAIGAELRSYLQAAVAADLEWDDEEGMFRSPDRKGPAP